MSGFVINPYALAAGAPGPGGPYLHYRLNITDNDGSALDARVSEFQLRTTIGGGNIASGGTATSNSQAGSHSSADKAFDGVQSTFWGSNTSHSFPLHLAYELPSAETVVEYAIQKYFNGGTGYSPSTWEFQGSHDGVNWVTLASESGVVWGGANYEMKVFTV